MLILALMQQQSNTELLQHPPQLVQVIQCGVQYTQLPMLRLPSLLNGIHLNMQLMAPVHLLQQQLVLKLESGGLLNVIQSTLPFCSGGSILQ